MWAFHLPSPRRLGCIGPSLVFSSFLTSIWTKSLADSQYSTVSMSCSSDVCPSGKFSVGCTLSDGLPLVFIPLWILPSTFSGLAAGAFCIQFGVQGAWGVVRPLSKLDYSSMCDIFSSLDSHPACGDVASGLPSYIPRRGIPAWKRASTDYLSLFRMTNSFIS